MILRLAEQLAVPTRDRNVLLVAAGYAPVFPERSLEDPALQSVRKAIDLVLESQKPFPAFALDRHWNLVASNAALPEIYQGVAPRLLAPPVNALRLTLHPEGLAPSIVNFQEWRAHSLTRLRRQIEITADPVLIGLLRELSAYPSPMATNPVHLDANHAMVVPFELNTSLGRLSFFTTTTMFGSPVDITLSELALECFYPANAATAEFVHRAANTKKQEAGGSPAPVPAKRIAS
jgi:hypothetical protein